MEFLITIIIVCLIWHFYILYKISKDNKRLNELYQKRFGEQERIERIIKEKPDNVVMQSDIIASELPLTYVGSLDKLNNRKLKNGDFVTKNGLIYLYKDGKLYEIINDLPSINYFPRY